MVGTSKGNKGKEKKLNAHPNTAKTRFQKGKSGFDPIKAGYPRWSIRLAQRHLAAQQIDPFDAEAIKKLIGNRELTIAETIAIRMLQRAFSKLADAEVVTNNIEGKLKEVREYTTPDDGEPFTPAKDLTEAIARRDARLKNPTKR